MIRKIHDIEQNTDEWLQLRMGLITASNFAAILANNGKAFGKPAIDYAQRIAIEKKTQRSIDTYSNEWMERGKELESEARELYEGLNFCEVHPGGISVAGRYGASADGQTEDNGLVEIKCVKYNTHFERLLKGGYDTKYQWQIHGQMCLYDVEYCDFISYCPDFPEDKQLYVYRVMRDLSLEDIMIERLEEFIPIVDKHIALL